MNDLNLALALARFELFEATEAIRSFDEKEFQDWAKQFGKLPEPVLRLGWAARKKTENTPERRRL